MLFQPGIKYRKAGVIDTRLVQQREVQTNLFVPANDRLGKLASIIEVTLAYGRGTVRIPSVGYKKLWKLKHEYLSPRYTTRWEDVKGVV